MNRREVLQLLTIATGGSVIVPTAFLSSCQSETYEGIFFSSQDIALFHEIGETILPKTDSSPGAKDIK
ncbi:MAG: gluconate 2-dehydrogenase subunit 3 family protein [Saprospiraceae bacterium]|nr:gluconate 2-dehydrogenase subunit 3 family protein [Saprospiraceae bacterium]